LSAQHHNGKRYSQQSQQQQPQPQLHPNSSIMRDDRSSALTSPLPFPSSTLSVNTSYTHTPDELLTHHGNENMPQDLSIYDFSNLI